MALCIHDRAWLPHSTEVFGCVHHSDLVRVVAVFSGEERRAGGLGVVNTRSKPRPMRSCEVVRPDEIVEGPLSSSFEEGTDNHDAADSDWKDRGGIVCCIEGLVVEAVPCADQRCSRCVTGLGGAVPDEVIHQRSLTRRMEG